MMLRLLITLCSSVGLVLSWSTTFVQDERIENPNSPPEYYDTEIKAHWHTNDKHTYIVCWKPPSGSDNGNKVCADPVSKGKISFMFTFVGHRFEVTQDDSASTDSKWPWPLGRKKSDEKKSDVAPGVVFEIVGGQHEYYVDQIYAAGTTRVKTSETGSNGNNDESLAVTLPVVYVRSPDDCSRGAWESVGGLWRDAIRRSAYRHGVGTPFPSYSLSPVLSQQAALSCIASLPTVQHSSLPLTILLRLIASTCIYIFSHIRQMLSCPCHFVLFPFRYQLPNDTLPPSLI